MLRSHWTLLCLTILSTHVQPSSSQILVDDCTGTYGGVAIFGRCFFLGNQTSNWDQAWDVCKANCKDATLAQVHSSFEYNAILLTNIPGSVWIALQRDNTTITCPGLAKSAYWYDGKGQRNQEMTMAVTWANQHCTDSGWHGPEEFYYYVKPDGTFQDLDAAGLITNSLCQVATCARDYTLKSSCIMMAPMKSLAVDEGLQGCANACSLAMWCRSFNYRPVTEDGDPVAEPCELFTWISTEPCPSCPPVAAMAGCLHYDADP